MSHDYPCYYCDTASSCDPFRSDARDHKPALEQSTEKILLYNYVAASTSLGKKLKPVGSTKRTGSTPTYVSRKRRTVRVILVLIVVFGVCRLPHWSFLLYKLHTTLKGNLTWHIQVVLTSLSLLNAAVHPYLYAFLNEALSLVTWLRTWCAGRRRQVTPIARPTSAILMKSTISAKIPRGPYRTP